MISGIYKIEFNESSIELNDRYEKFTNVEKENISSLSAESYLDFDNNGKYTFYVITSPVEIDRYLEILKNNSIEYKFTNLYKDVLNNKYDFNKLKENLNAFNIIKWDFFMEDLSDWIIENLDIDIILDRINEVGINNLTNTENKFLNNYKIV